MRVIGVGRRKHAKQPLRLWWEEYRRFRGAWGSSRSNRATPWSRWWQRVLGDAAASGCPHAKIAVAGQGPYASDVRRLWVTRHTDDVRAAWGSGVKERCDGVQEGARIESGFSPDV